MKGKGRAITVLKNNFIFFKTKKKENVFDNKNLFFSILFIFL